MKTKKTELKEFVSNIRSFFKNTDVTLAYILNGINSQISMYEYWLKRVNASVIDYILVFIATGLILPTAHILELILVTGITSLLYFTAMESFFGYTIGKRLFSLKVLNLDGTKTSMKRCFTRNISKVNVVFLLLDTIAGFYTSKTHQKYIDRIVNTTVDSPVTRITAAKIINYRAV